MASACNIHEMDTSWCHSLHHAASGRTRRVVSWDSSPGLLSLRASRLASLASSSTRALASAA
eukprot:scaffold26793_cov30-Tisochrysis_lutea.AAC.3